MGGHGEEAVGWGDTDSEKGIVHPPRKAILQTTTVTVEYTDEQRR